MVEKLILHSCNYANVMHSDNAFTFTNLTKLVE